MPGVLSAEFARMLQEIQLGVPRADAFRNLAERTDVEELNAFALAMIQADVFGVSIAERAAHAGPAPDQAPPAAPRRRRSRRR